MDGQDYQTAWRERLADAAQSGLSVKEWCSRNGFSIDQYYYWKRRLPDPSGGPAVLQERPDRKSAAVGRSERPSPDRNTAEDRGGRSSSSQLTPQRPRVTPAPEWLPVAVEGRSADSVAPSCLTLRIAGAEIDLRTGFDAALLRSVVAALGGAAC